MDLIAQSPPRGKSVPSREVKGRPRRRNPLAIGMVGAVVLARAVDDLRLSDEILREVRKSPE